MTPAHMALRTMWPFLLALMCANGALAQATMPFDHVHVAVPDPIAAATWYRQVPTAQPGLTPDRVVFGGTIVAFQQARAATASSAGSGMDHFAVSVPDVDGALKKLEGAGAKILERPHDDATLHRVGVLQDPWGAKIELVQDPRVQGFHHMHLRVPHPDESLQWYARMFGGERGTLGTWSGVQYGGVWLLVDASIDGEALPTAGHAIDHIGWRPQNVDDKVRELKVKGATILSEPRDYTDLRFAFVESFDGLRIELTQRPVR